MHVRKRINKSGSTSVFVVASKRIKGKKYPRAVVVKSFGSSKDINEINKLCLKAEEFAKSTKYTPFLRINNESDVDSCKSKNIGFSDLFGKIFDKYFPMNNSILKELVLMRIANPVSKLQTSKIAQGFNCNELSINKIYKFMDTMKDDVIDSIKNSIFSNTKKLLGNDDINVLFYDLTTIYFENNTETSIKKTGFSKDGKSQHVQISLALIVTEFGLPIGYEIFPGNTYEGKTLIPVLDKIRNKYKINNVTIIADSAMLNKVNLESLIENKFNYIVSARTKNLNKELAEQMLNGEYSCLNDDIKYQIINLDNKRLVLCYSKERAIKDAYDRSITLKRLDKFLGKSINSSIRGSLKKPYVKLSNKSTLELDYKKLEDTKMFDGYFGFYTNTGLDAKNIIYQYRGLWQVEQTFRITKHNLSIRPVYHYKDRRISAHFAICFLSLALIRTVEFLLIKKEQKISLNDLNQLLKDVNLVEILNKNQKFNIVTDIPERLQSIYLALDIQKPKTFSFQNFDLL